MKPKLPTIKDLRSLIISIKGDICDSYVEEEGDLPSIQLTIGCSPLKGEWSYQTGDNSYTGGAYFHRHWGIATIYRRSRSADLARDIIAQIKEGFYSSNEGVTI